MFVKPYLKVLGIGRRYHTVKMLKAFGEIRWIIKTDPIGDLGHRIHLLGQELRGLFLTGSSVTVPRGLRW